MTIGESDAGHHSGPFVASTKKTAYGGVTVIGACTKTWNTKKSTRTERRPRRAKFKVDFKPFSRYTLPATDILLFRVNESLYDRGRRSGMIKNPVVLKVRTRYQQLQKRQLLSFSVLRWISTIHVYFYEHSRYYSLRHKIGITDVSNGEFFIVRDYHRFIGHIDVGRRLNLRNTACVRHW